MQGEYRFYQEGKLVGVHKNIVTTLGRNAIQRFLAGTRSRWAGTIVVGSIDTAATAADRELYFEYARTPVSLIVPDLAAGVMTVKATLPADVAGKIYEIGVHTEADSAITTVERALITDFDSASYTLTNGSVNATQTRVGTESRSITANASGNATVELDDIFIDITPLESTDEVALAYYVADANLSSITIHMKTDDSNYYTQTKTATGAAGYKVLKFKKNAFTATGAPTWAQINSCDFLIQATAGGSCTVHLDGFAVVDQDLTGQEGLVSRAVVAVQTKLATQPLDVEYKINLAAS